jgi:Protein of unknown function (DUF3551)
MRHLAIAIGSAVALATLAATPALADKAPWCAQFGGGRGGGGTECLYYSFAQCQATLSGMGGRCFQNPWFGSSSRDYRGDDRRRY